MENGELELTPLESKSKYIDEDDEGQKVVYNYAYFDLRRYRTDLLWKRYLDSITTIWIHQNGVIR